MYNDVEERTNSPSFDLSAFSPRAQRRLLVHMDMQGELAMADTISIQRVAIVSNRALAAYVAISQTAAAAAQAVPYEAERIDALVAHAHRRLCDILDGERRY